MKKLSKVLFISLILVAAIAVTAICVAAATTPPPFSVLITDQSGYEYEILPERVDGKYTFYLPGSADLSDLTVKYTGKKMLCDENGDVTLYRGDTLTCKASGGKIEVKEYDSSTKSYEKHSANVLCGGEIGSVYITLDGGTKALKNINANKNNEEPGDIIVLDKVGNLVYDGSMTKLSGHGFTSFTAASSTNIKNSYNLNIAQKTELVNGAGDSKKWVLLTPRMYAGDRDTTGLSQISAFHTFTALIGNKRASIEGEYVDLYINGEYRGLYILTERMNNGGAIDVVDLEDHVTNASSELKTLRDHENTGRDPALNTGLHKYTYDKKAKIDSDVDITGGYVLEVMCDTYEGCGFETKYGLDISIKSPEVCTKEMVQYIAAYVQNFENAIYSETGYNSEGKHYTEYADMRSLADMILVYSYYINFEYFRTSTYIYKDADGESNDLLTFGPAWDFETGATYLKNDKTLFGTTNWFVYNVDQQYIWSEQLWQHGDFMSYLASENDRMKDVLSQQLGYTESFTVPSLESVTAAASASADMNHKRWGATNFNDIFGEFIDAVDSRYDHWYGTLWNPDKYLICLDTEVTKNEDGTVTLRAAVTGENDGKIRWYKIDEKDPEKSETVAIFFDEITVTEDGSLYYYTVTGKNNAYYEHASGSIFSDENITMISGPTAATYVEPEPDPIPETTIDDNTDENGCSGSVSPAALIIAVLALPIYIKRKKSY